MKPLPGDVDLVSTSERSHDHMMDLAGEKRGFVCLFVWEGAGKVAPQKYHRVVLNEALLGSFVPFSGGFLYIFILHPRSFHSKFDPLKSDGSLEDAQLSFLLEGVGGVKFHHYKWPLWVLSPRQNVSNVVNVRETNSKNGLKQCRLVVNYLCGIPVYPPKKKTDNFLTPLLTSRALFCSKDAKFRSQHSLGIRDRWIWNPHVFGIRV